MKKFVSALCLMICAGPSANAIIIPTQAVALESIAGKVTFVEPLCRKGETCAVNGTRLSLEFPGSCRGKIIDPVYQTYGGDVVIHAQRAVERDSLMSLCFNAPGAGFWLNLVDVYPPMTVRFLGTKQSVQIN